MGVTEYRAAMCPSCEGEPCVAGECCRECNGVGKIVVPLRTGTEQPTRARLIGSLVAALMISFVILCFYFIFKH